MKLLSVSFNLFKKFFKGYFHILKKIFFLVSISYVIYHLYLNINDIKFENNLQNYNVYISFAFCLSSIIINGIAYKNIIKWFGESKKINNLIGVYIFTNSLKYIPGGIWHFIERYNFLKKNIKPKIALYSLLIEPYLMLSSASLLISFFLFYNPIYFLFIIPTILLNKKLVYYILSRLESLKNNTINIVKVNISRKKFDIEVNIKTFFPSQAILIEMIFILFKFLGFIFCFNIFNQEIYSNIYPIFIIFCLSWSIGLIIPAAPGGIGVFEACFIFLSRNNYSESALIMSLIYFRIISTLTDLSLSAPFLWKKYIRR